jgi:hypothetical protein
MYEWVETAKGWRIFWGVDPCAKQEEAHPPDVDRPTPRSEVAESVGLRLEHEPEIQTSA